MMSATLDQSGPSSDASDCSSLSGRAKWHLPNHLPNGDALPHRVTVAAAAVFKFLMCPPGKFGSDIDLGRVPFPTSSPERRQVAPRCIPGRAAGERLPFPAAICAIFLQLGHHGTKLSFQLITSYVNSTFKMSR